MAKGERDKHLRSVQAVHTKASDPQGEILIMLEQAPWLGHRVLLTRLESGLQQRPCGSERGHCYRSDVDDAFDQIPVEHLTPNLAWAATRLCQHGELQVISRLPTQLDAISNAAAGPSCAAPDRMITAYGVEGLRKTIAPDRRCPLSICRRTGRSPAVCRPIDSMAVALA
ncbi:MAG: hypothetical protein ACOX3S_15405 [Anaerolineae bacterium]|jgi:hypothetical protein